MPEGTILGSEAHFDSSSDSPDPRRPVTFGEQPKDEMHVGYFRNSAIKLGEKR